MNETIRVTAKQTARIGLQVKAAKVKVSPGNSGNVPIVLFPDMYNGRYKVAYSETQQTLETKNKLMRSNVVIDKTPVTEVYNSAGGIAFYIGKELEIMGNSKIVYNSETLIDLTSDTVTEETLLKGYTAHNAAGDVITGTCEGEEVTVTPTAQEQVILPNSAKGASFISQVTVAAIPYKETDNAAGGKTITIG